LAAQTDKAQKTEKNEKAEKSERKLIYKEVPVYPAELKSHYIGGKVRLKIGISPRGTVETVTTMGGNPILTEAAVAAVKKWKYVPAASATTIDVEFTFNPFH
jgi:TonB family protein